MDTKAIPGAPWILILGPKGAGKTRLAATYEHNFCLDTEPPGSATAYPPDYRKAFSSDNQLYGNVTRFVTDLQRGAKKGDRAITWEGRDIAALTIDTFDTLQKFLISRYLEPKLKKRPNWISPDEIWYPKMEQNDWGTILNFQAPLITQLKTLTIPVIWVCHTKEVEPLYDGRGENQHLVKAGKRMADVSGSIEGWILNLCDYILNITVGEGGVRTVHTQPGIVDGYEITAADRHRLFVDNKATTFPVPIGEDGNPTRKVIKFICDNHVY